MTQTLTRVWPTNPASAERQAAAYLPLRGSRIDLLPTAWPDTEGFPKPATVLRELTAWFAQVGPQPMVSIPDCVEQWLTSIPATHTVMLVGVPWLREQGDALWPTVAVANLIAMYEAIQHGGENPFVVTAVQDAVEQWMIFQAIRTHLHAAIGRVAKQQGVLPSSEPQVLDALITAWQAQLGPTALPAPDAIH